MALLPGYKNTALLRCRFDFSDGRTWFSMWNESGPNDCDKAAYQNKNGLIRASIEAKNRETRRTAVIAECDGHEFCNFEWMALAVAPSALGGKSKQILSQNVGLALVTSEQRVCVFMNGEIKIEKRSDTDKLFHYAGYGR